LHSGRVSLARSLAWDDRMIHYQLQCGQNHAFDGWFKDSASFGKQARRGLLECPVCGDAAVERALMAPAVPRKGRGRRVEADAAPAVEASSGSASGGPVAVAGARMPDHVRAMMQKLRAEIERNCDYVGEDFADEARRIHRGESDRRGIYGETSADDAESLAEEGIAVASVPWVPRADG
jgi:hypothetical protein